MLLLSGTYTCVEELGFDDAVNLNLATCGSGSGVLLLCDDITSTYSSDAFAVTHGSVVMLSSVVCTKARLTASLQLRPSAQQRHVCATTRDMELFSQLSVN